MSSSSHRCASIRASRTISYRRVECYCDGPFVDLFARKRRPAWDTWGDQVDMFSGGVS